MKHKTVMEAGVLTLMQPAHFLPIEDQQRSQAGTRLYEEHGLRTQEMRLPDKLTVFIWEWPMTGQAGKNAE